MASSTSIYTLHHRHLFSITLCKFPSSQTLKFYYLSPFFASSPSKHTPFFLGSNAHSNLPKTNHGSPTKGVTFRVWDSGFSSLRTIDKRVVINSVKDSGSSVVAEGGNGRNEIGLRRRRIESLKKRVKKDQTGHDTKKNVNPLEVHLRVQLEMCSKNGDVMRAIQLYDLAQREGISMGQYHYTVLLYLCSSAALGAVKPAKSGSTYQTRNLSESSIGTSSDNYMELSESRDKDDINTSDAQLGIQVSDKSQLIGDSRNPQSFNKMELNSDGRFDNTNSSFNGEENLVQFSNRFSKTNSQQFERLSFDKKVDEADSHDDPEIWISEDIKKYALQRGLEIYEKMCVDEVPMSEAILTAMARMAMAMGDGDMAFDMVKKMTSLGLSPRLRSYGPALSVYCNSGEGDKAFAVEKHMLEHGISPEEPEVEALLRVSVEAGKGDKVYYLLHKLRTSVRKVSPSTAGIIERWFKSTTASRVGKMKWDKNVIHEALAKGGGGWHGQGWLGKGKWEVSHTSIGTGGFCNSCGEQLTTIDLDPIETANFAKSVASLAIKREKYSSFQRFQKWLDYYGPFEAVVDGANVGMFSNKTFLPSKINGVVNAIRKKLPSKNWPLIILHNSRITGRKMNQPVNETLFEKWKNADALYLTPNGSNDDWYWLYAAIIFKCFIVTNDEMRDHTFQLLGNDFFPKWKERHQVRFSFTDAGPVFHMPPPYSVVIQESDKGQWHVPIATDQNYEEDRAWLCITRSKTHTARRDSVSARPKDPPGSMKASLTVQTKVAREPEQPKHGKPDKSGASRKKASKNLRNSPIPSALADHSTILPDIASAEKLGDCVIDFQI